MQDVAFVKEISINKNSIYVSCEYRYIIPLGVYKHKNN